MNTAGLSQFESGGGGLVSTIDDYFAFSRMMDSPEPPKIFTDFWTLATFGRSAHRREV